MKEEELEKAEKKEPKPIVLVSDVDKDGHSVFKCLSTSDEELVKTALSNPHGIKVKSAERKTCPIEPKKPYEKSICKKIDKLFEEREKKRKEKEKSEAE